MFSMFLCRMEAMGTNFEEPHFDLTDKEFEVKFAKAELDPSLFSHEAHLRLAWIHIRAYGLEKAEENIRQQLMQFVEKVGARDKYHETVTVAAIRMVHHFLQRSQSNNFRDFIQEWPRLKNSFKELIESHYSFDIFTSEVARARFMGPDILPFE